MPLFRAYLFPWAFMFNWNRKDWASLFSLMSRNSALNSLVRVIFLFLSSLLGGLVLPPLLDEVLVCLLISSVLWWNHFPLTARCSLHHQYSFPSLIFFTAPPCVSFSIQGGMSLVYYGSPLVDSLLYVLDLSDYLFECLLAFGPLQLELGSGNPWDPCWSTSLK